MKMNFFYQLVQILLVAAAVRGIPDISGDDSVSDSNELGHLTERIYDVGYSGEVSSHHWKILEDFFKNPDRMHLPISLIQFLTDIHAKKRCSGIPLRTIIEIGESLLIILRKMENYIAPDFKPVESTPPPTRPPIRPPKRSPLFQLPGLTIEYLMRHGLANKDEQEEASPEFRIYDITSELQNPNNDIEGSWKSGTPALITPREAALWGFNHPAIRYTDDDDVEAGWRSRGGGLHKIVRNDQTVHISVANEPVEDVIEGNNGEQSDVNPLATTTRRFLSNIIPTFTNRKASIESRLPKRHKSNRDINNNMNSNAVKLEQSPNGVEKIHQNKHPHDLPVADDNNADVNGKLLVGSKKLMNQSPRIRPLRDNEATASLVHYGTKIALPNSERSYRHRNTNIN